MGTDHHDDGTRHPHEGHGRSRGHSHGPGQGPGHAHGHGHGHGTDIDWEAMADQLEGSGSLRLPALRATAARLRALAGPDRPVRRVLDVGSGPGVLACVLAEEFPEAEVVAVDGTRPLLDRALARAERLGLGGRVTALHAEFPGGLADLGEADLVWTSQVVHHIGDQQAALGALAAALRPGGRLAVAEGGLPMRFLPRDIGVGEPGLQARLDAYQAEWFTAMRAELPGSVAVREDWPRMLRTAGLAEVTSFTTLLDLPAPLPDAARRYLHGHLTRLREGLSDGLLTADLPALDALLDPEGPDGILHRPDAFLLTADTVITGVREG